MVPSVIIVLVTLPVSPVVTTVPVTFGRVIVRSAVGSVTVKVVSKSSADEPSNTTLVLVPKFKSPVIVPPAFASFSVSTSCNAACTSVAAIVPLAMNEMLAAV